MGHRSNNAHEHRGSKYHKWSGIEHNKMKWSEIKIEKKQKKKQKEPPNPLFGHYSEGSKESQWN